MTTLASAPPSSLVEWPDVLTRREASEYLRTRHRLRASVFALERWAFRGNGPVYRKQGNGQALYQRTDLDAFAEERLGRPIRGPHELREAVA